MTPRRCSCCLQTGHNILRCDDEHAHAIMNRILYSDENTALTLVERISNNLVSFVSVRAYNLPARSNRSALRARVIEDYNQRTQDLMVRLQSNRVPIQTDVETLHRRTNQLVRDFYTYHPESAPRVYIYSLLVKSYLRRLEQAAHIQVDIEFNRFISLRLTISIATACDSMNSLLTDIEIRHLDNMARMYNYERLLANSNTFETLWPRVVNEEPRPMKVLPIKITLCAPCQKDDTCGVCFDDLSPEKLVKTGCGHIYCSTCIAGVAHQRGIKSFIPCPGCRADIVELEVYNEEEHQLVIDGLKPVV